jgi:hypothetical protein
MAGDVDMTASEFAELIEAELVRAAERRLSVETQILVLEVIVRSLRDGLLASEAETDG